MKILATNRISRTQYELIKKYEAGISLLGSEVKSIKKGDVSLDNSFIFFKKNESYISNMYVKKYDKERMFEIDELRPRKLLLHKKEIINLEFEAKKFKLILIPTKIYMSKDLIKLEFFLAKHLKKFEKREAEKKKNIQKEMKNYL